MTISSLSIGKYVALLVDWMNMHFSGIFEMLSFTFETIVKLAEKVLLYPSPSVIIILVVLAAWRVSGKGLALFALIGLYACYILNLWHETMLTSALVVISAFLALLIALPLGIIAATSDAFERALRPVMDFMQTMPPWVYLVPAVIFFSLGRTPAVFATALFSIPPPLRLTCLGIRQVPEVPVEAGKAFGATPLQILAKIQIPLALPTIMAGVNQCIMLSLSMVVLAGLIGAGGLGGEVVRGLTRMMIGVGIRAGLAIVILAILFDRMTIGLLKLFQKGNVAG